MKMKLLSDTSFLPQTSIGSANLIESPPIELLFLLSAAEPLSHPSAHLWVSQLHSNIHLLMSSSTPPSTSSSPFNILIPTLSREMPVPLGPDPAADERGQRPGVDRTGDRVHQHRGEDHQGQSGAD